MRIFFFCLLFSAHANAAGLYSNFGLAPGAVIDGEGLKIFSRGLVTEFKNPKQITSNGCVIDENRIKCPGVGYPEQYEITNPVVLASNGSYTCAIGEGGIKCWGFMFGSPSVPALKNPRKIAVGEWHACAIDDEGVTCWGDDSLGQLKPPALVNPKEISAGHQHTCAVDDEGVKCWGAGTDKGEALFPPAMKKVIALSTNYRFTCAAHDEGISCWGFQVPDEAKSIPRQGARWIAADHTRVCAMGNDWFDCWGDPKARGPLPVRIEKAEQFSTDGSRGCLLGEGHVQCIGGEHSPHDFSPNLRNPKLVRTGRLGSCAIDDTGVQCWGPSYLEKIPAMNQPTELAIGDSVACAIAEGKRLHCWGEENALRELKEFSEPVEQMSLAGNVLCLVSEGKVLCPKAGGNPGVSKIPDLKNPRWVKVDEKGNQACALDDEGLQCWGAVQYYPPPHFKQITDLQFESDHVCAISQGEVWCWGKEYYAQRVALAVKNPREVRLHWDYACAVGDEQSECWLWRTNRWHDRDPRPLLPANVTITDLAVSYDSACGLVDGKLRCWHADPKKNNSNPKTFLAPIYLRYPGQAFGLDRSDIFYERAARGASPVRAQFLSGLARYFRQDLSASVENDELNQARFVLAQAAGPSIRSMDSAYFRREVLPVYAQSLASIEEELGAVKRGGELANKAALHSLLALVGASEGLVGANERAQLQELKRLVGMALASPMDLNRLSQVKEKAIALAPLFLGQARFAFLAETFAVVAGWL